MKTTMKEGEENSFWDRLESDVEAIGKRARQKLKKYEHDTYQTIQQNRNPKPNSSHHKTIEDFEGMKRTDIFKAKNREESRQRQIKNRFSYLSREKERKNSTLQQAKKKYQHLIEARNNNINQKPYLKKRRNSFMIESKEKINGKLTYIKESKKTKVESREKLQKSGEKSTSFIRRQSSLNKHIVSKEKIMNYQKNHQKEQKSKSSSENSKSKFSSISLKKPEIQRSTLRRRKTQDIQRLQLNRKQNINLIQKLKSETERIKRNRLKAERQMENYCSILGIGKEKKPPKTYKRSKSFYVTSA